MTSNTRLNLILGTGRNGSQQIYKIFRENKYVESYHEFNFEEILQLGIQKQVGYINSKNLRGNLENSYIQYVNNCKKRIWIDSSNALPWVAQELSEIWDDTCIIFLARNGRKVINSFFNKFPAIMYPEHEYQRTIDWIKSKFKKNLMPDNSKIYWRPFIDEMIDDKNLQAGIRFKMLCYYFKLNVEKSLDGFYSGKKLNLFKFEELLNDKNKRNEFCNLLKVDTNFLERKFIKPTNIVNKFNFKFNDTQEMVFRSICRGTMIRLGYSIEDDYEVNY